MGAGPRAVRGTQVVLDETSAEEVRAMGEETVSAVGDDLARCAGDAVIPMAGEAMRLEEDDGRGPGINRNSPDDPSQVPTMVARRAFAPKFPL